MNLVKAIVLRLYKDDMVYVDKSYEIKDILIPPALGRFNPKITRDFLDINSINLKNKKLYRYPKITLPREKVNILKEKYGISVVRDVEKADYSIVNEDPFKDVLAYCYGSINSVFDVKALFIENIALFNSDSLNFILNEIDNVKDEIQHVILKMPSYYHNFSFKIINNTNISNYYFTIKDNEKFLNLSLNNNFILDTDLLNLTTEDSCTLTSDDYDTLKTMITSYSKNDINLALEIMSNCNIAKSFDILAFLHYQYFNVLKDYSTNWNNVNIKALRKKLFNYMPYGNEDVQFYDRFLKKITEDNALTDFIFEKVQSLTFERLNNYVFGVGSVFNIDIESLSLKDDIKERMKKEL